jgi:hypothetical protein
MFNFSLGAGSPDAAKAVRGTMEKAVIAAVEAKNSRRVVVLSRIRITPRLLASSLF